MVGPGHKHQPVSIEGATGMNAIGRAGLSLLLMVGLIAASVYSQPQPPADVPAGTVLVWGFSPLGRSQSTGVLIDAQERLILGSYHALYLAETIVFMPPLLRDGKPDPDPQAYQDQYKRKEAWPARIIHIDFGRDVVVLRADALPDGLQPARLAARPPAEGDKLVVLGNPAERNSLFERRSAKSGSLGVREWVYGDGQGVYAEFLDVSVAGTPGVGYSGGPVVNAEGELVAVVTANQPDAPADLLCLTAAEIRRAWAGALRQIALAAGSDPKQIGDQKVLGDPKLFKHYCERAVKLDGDTAAEPTIRGLLQQRAGARAQAHAAYTEALQRNPLYLAAWLGWIRSR